MHLTQADLKEGEDPIRLTQPATPTRSGGYSRIIHGPQTYLEMQCSLLREMLRGPHLRQAQPKSRPGSFQCSWGAGITYQIFDIWCIESDHNLIGELIWMIKCGIKSGIQINCCIVFDIRIHLSEYQIAILHFDMIPYIICWIQVFDRFHFDQR